MITSFFLLKSICINISSDDYLVFSVIEWAWMCDTISICFPFEFSVSILTETTDTHKQNDTVEG